MKRKSGHLIALHAVKNSVNESTCNKTYQGPPSSAGSVDGATNTARPASGNLNEPSPANRTWRGLCRFVRKISLRHPVDLEQANYDAEDDDGYSEEAEDTAAMATPK